MTLPSFIRPDLQPPLDDARTKFFRAATVVSGLTGFVLFCWLPFGKGMTALVVCALLAQLFFHLTLNARKRNYARLRISG